jgi:type I restriction enzyme M protein
VRQLIREQANVVAVVDCPLETFLPSTPTKVGLLVVQKKASPTDRQGTVFMAVAEKCGHDRRGVPIWTPDGRPADDLPEIAKRFAEFKRQQHVRF